VTPLYHVALSLGATFRDADGWRVPDRYVSTTEETDRARAAAGLADMSAGGRIAVRGASIEPLFTKLSGLALPAASIASRARIDGAEVLVCRLAPDEVLVLTGAAEAAGVQARLERAAESVDCAHVTEVTSAFATLELIGPAVPSLLARLVAIDLSPTALPAFGVAQGELAGVRAVILRLDHPRLPALRVLVAREVGEFVWTALVDAGRDLGLVPIGLAAHARLMAETP
jgi:aminomethyltransferase